MAIKTTPSKVHWNYFVALERDLELASRYVEFCDGNMKTYSIEFAHMLIAAASEVDVLAKLVCEQLEPASKCERITEYREVLTKHLPDLASMQVFVPRYGLSLMPWDKWANGNGVSPTWWRSYNKVKHERNAHYEKATLKNALNALAGLLCLLYYYYGHAVKAADANARPMDITNTLDPASSLMKLDSSFYFVPVVATP